MSNPRYNPAAPFYSSDRTKKLVLAPGGSSGTTMTIATAQSVNVVVTIPNTGTDSSFVMADGDQTVNGVKSFTSNISLVGITFPNGNRTIRVLAPATGPGSSLTLIAGYASLISGNTPGGDLVLSSGYSSGTGSADVVSMTHGVAAAGTGLNSTINRSIVASTRVTLASNPISVAKWNYTTAAAIGAVLSFSLTVKAGSDYQCYSGTLSLSHVDSTHYSIVESGVSSTVTSGTLSVVWGLIFTALGNSTTDMTLTCTTTTSLTPDTLYPKLTFRLDNNSETNVVVKL